MKPTTTAQCWPLTGRPEGLTQERVLTLEATKLSAWKGHHMGAEEGLQVLSEIIWPLELAAACFQWKGPFEKRLNFTEMYV